MTRKDYVLVAHAIRQAKDNGANVGEVTQRVADELSNDNPRFDYDKFLTACGF